MPTPTPIIEDLLTVPTGTQVYDALMFDIEPELITENLAHLDEPYTQETPEGRVRRYDHYRESFEMYDIAFNEWISALSSSVQTYKRQALKSEEQESNTEDMYSMNALEEEFSKEVPKVTAS